MKKNINMFIVLIISSFLGIFAQSIADFIKEKIYNMPSIYYLSFFTFLSIFLFLFVLVRTFILMKKNKRNQNDFILMIFLVALLGIPTTFWSLFVLGMWWSY